MCMLSGGMLRDESSNFRPENLDLFHLGFGHQIGKEYFIIRIIRERLSCKDQATSPILTLATFPESASLQMPIPLA